MYNPQSGEGSNFSPLQLGKLQELGVVIGNKIGGPSPILNRVTPEKEKGNIIGHF